MATEKHISLLFYKVTSPNVQTQVIDSLCYILIVLGLVGNILGLFIFSSCRRSWRISSVYACLATASSITNLLCVIRYAFILHSKLRNILHDLVGQNWWACKIYQFSVSFRVVSSWITLFWMFERLLCVSMTLQRFFNQWNSFSLKFLIPFGIMLVILGFVIGPPVYMFQPELLGKDRITDLTIDLNKTYCDVDAKASLQWKAYFYDVQFGINHSTIRCLFSELIPTGGVIVLNSYIIYHVARTWRRLHKIHGYRLDRKQSRTTSWMTRVLLLHSFLFLSSLLSHVAAHFIAVEAHETYWVLLAILINCSLNFYIYCLSGKAFRNEIHRFIRQLKIQVTYMFNMAQNPKDQHCLRKNLVHIIPNSKAIVELNLKHADDIEDAYWD